MTTTLLDRASRDNRRYRAMRKEGVKVREAVAFIRDDNELERAEIDGAIKFDRVHDVMYQAERGYSDNDDTETKTEMERFYQEEDDKLASGEYVAYGIIATAAADHAFCRTCRRASESREASLWGIVVDSSPSGDRYLRQVEIELAQELGIITGE
jgi:hypothetical protein